MQRPEVLGEGGRSRDRSSEPGTEAGGILRAGIPAGGRYFDRTWRKGGFWAGG
jgi:hypothetical protein